MACFTDARLIWAVLSQMLFMRFGADDDKLTKIRESVLKVTKGWDHDEVRALVAETINDVIEPLIYSEALELIDHHLAEGDEVFLVSMSPAEIVEPFAELLGITGAISSRSRIDENGKFTGEMEFFAQGENKAVAMRELAGERGIDLEASFAYSDSETDIPMLESRSDTPSRSTPTDRSRRWRTIIQWPILTFTPPGARARPVQVAHAVLRERCRHRRRGRRSGA